MKKILLAFTLITSLLLPVGSVAQKKNAASDKTSAVASARIEPARTASGVMKGRVISVRRSDWINDGTPLLDFTLSEARLARGHLEFIGTAQSAGQAGAQMLTAQLAATSARSANPWPSATSATAKERRAAAKKERGEVNEQTQSLYSAAEAGSGCELLFLKLTPPGEKTPLQVGVVLAHQDNARGEEINHAVCRIVRALTAKGNPGKAVAELNRLLSRE
ncbi:MAG TPA: hypothetical protein VNQ79_11795 [Blastocatellia bacterium]|nr:hypothetical protein [Blastocatellia bacterium]